MHWRTIEWSVVMGALCWLFVRMWSESPYDRNRRERRSWLRRAHTDDAARPHHEPGHAPPPEHPASPGL